MQFDWLYEEPFAHIARQHPAVHEMIPYGRLRWKKQRFSRSTLSEQVSFYRELRACKYDAVIDVQGRIKSARVTWLFGAPVYGLDAQVATDSDTPLFI
ncbi:glycosyltransferase family 9 protein [Parathalassolituus penaei]|uniref:Uncharacterized protein n=1 Tax=Parathalassolituus penaei TaxID=2997323 RepID=A0A9X3ISZ9_9GAMM|nr:glycosyltransferase family 9 protein [Parathalassolituus penaei]MCY0966366.1 hypothetical protein [Parathalassolituus penaei]